MNKKLTPRQREFCERYLLTSNAAASARAAGYAEGTARDAYRMLRRPEVAAYLARRGRELIDERVNPRRVLLELACVAFADITDYAVVEKGRVRVLDTPGSGPEGEGRPTGAGRRWGACVQSLKQGAAGVRDGDGQWRAKSILRRCGGFEVLFAGRDARMKYFSRRIELDEKQIDRSHGGVGRVY